MDTQIVTGFFSLRFLEQRSLKVQLSAYGGPRNFVQLTRGPRYIKRLDTAGPCSEPNKFNEGL